MSKQPVLLTAAGIVTLMAVLGFTGVPVLTAVLLTLFVLWQTVAGVAVWRWLRPAGSLLEVAGAAVAVGTALAALSGLLTSTLGIGPWGWALPSAVAVVTWLALRLRTATSKKAAALTIDRSSLWGLFAGVVPGLAILGYSLRLYPLTWSGSWTGYHPDMPFFEALSTSLARFGAFESPFMVDGVVRYHWLSYAWAGQLNVAADAAPFVTITRVLPVVALFGCAAMVAAWVRSLSPQTWTPTLGGLLLSVGGFVGAVFGGVLTMDSPSQSMSVLWLIAFAIAVVHVTTSRVRLLPAVALIGTLALALIGGKVSAAAPAVAGVIVMVCVQLLRGDVPRSRSSWTLAATILGSLTGFLLFLSGSVGGGGLTIGSMLDRASSQQGLNPIETRYAVAMGTLILVLAVLPRWAGVVWLVTRSDWRWRPEVTLSAGLGTSSIVALLAFNSFNEVWFSSTVSGPLAAISAVGVGNAIAYLSVRPKPTPRTILTVSVACAAAIFFIVALLWATGASGGNTFTPTLRWLGPVAAGTLALVAGVAISLWGRGRLTGMGVVAGAAVVLVLVSVPGRLLGVGTGLVGMQENGLRSEWFSGGGSTYLSGPDRVPIEDWTSTRMEAARWLRDASEPTDVLATNLTFGPFVAGVTQLPTFVSARWYQTPYGLPWMTEELLLREQQSWAFIEDPSAESVAPLCRAGVRWLWVDLARTDARSWAPYAVTTLENEDTAIAEFDGNACSDQ